MKSPLTVPSQCGCKSTTAHLHYSSNHDFFVRLGLVCFLLVEGLSFVSGAVRGSTFLYLGPEERGAYHLVSRSIEELVAPYAPLTFVRVAVELIALALGAAAVATLHSVRERKTHEATTLCAAAIVSVGMALNWLHSSLVNRALLQLPNLVCQWTPSCYQFLELATRAEARFAAKYGFWGSPSEYVILVFSVACLILLWAAALTTRVASVWQPTPAVPSMPAVPEPAAPPKEPPTAVVPAMPTKFCRFCGAKIPRVSKYCEECGKKVA